ncbi:hypothetical protein RvY_00467 [Ramazzottius varieornatus]|uniref:Chitin-binding type-2 domain-containing protein n=1 Tax=Ramazzottius varieornatus TaxID=947166 RepID=A0A1D1UDU4_RAMVA|nr:hypothetical protein RvY_00467 [Ramazzottius varieornatus]
MESVSRTLWTRVFLVSGSILLCLHRSDALGQRPFSDVGAAGAPGYSCTLSTVCSETRSCPVGCRCTLRGIPCLSGSVCSSFSGASSPLFCLCPTSTIFDSTTNSCVEVTAPTVRPDPGPAPNISVINPKVPGLQATVRRCFQTPQPDDDEETRRLNLRLVVTNSVSLDFCEVKVVETYLGISRKKLRKFNKCSKRDFLVDVSGVQFVDINKGLKWFVLTHEGPPEGPRGGYLIQRYSITCTGKNGLTSNPVQFVVAFPSCANCKFQRDSCPVDESRPGRQGNGCERGRVTRPPSARQCLQFYFGNNAPKCPKLYLRTDRLTVTGRNTVSAVMEGSRWTPDSFDNIVHSAEVPMNIQPEKLMNQLQQLGQTEDEDIVTQPPEHLVDDDQNDEDDTTADTTTTTTTQAPIEQTDDEQDDEEEETTTHTPNHQDNVDDDDGEE